MSKKFSYSTKQMTTLALLTAACTVGRLSFSMIPNVQPMTAILLLLAFFTPLQDALLVALLSLLLTNLYLGMGPWTISQFVAFTSVILLFHLLGKSQFFKRFVFFQALFAFLSGLLYGVVVSFMEVNLYHLPSFIAYYVRGIPFDFSHSVGNFVFYLLFYPFFLKIFLPNLKKSKESSFT